MNCPNCNTPIDTNDIFCGECGYDMRSSPPATSLPPQSPPVNSAQPAPPPPLQASAPPPTPQVYSHPEVLPTPKKKKRRWWLIALIIVILMSICLCAAWGFYDWWITPMLGVG